MKRAFITGVLIATVIVLFTIALVLAVQPGEAR